MRSFDIISEPNLRCTGAKNLADVEGFLPKTTLNDSCGKEFK